MKTLRIILVGLAAGAALLLLPATARATIVGSQHDFYTQTNYWIGGSPSWISGSATRTNVCSECHTIHHAPDPTTGPLWIHTPSSQTYKTYDQAGSETFDALGLTVTLGSSSKACLSCHDGTVAINDQTSLIEGPSGTSTNSIKGGTPVFIADDRIIPINNNDLTHMHPIGVSYTAAAAALPAGDLQPTSHAFTAPGNLTVNNQLKGVNKTVECSTCHDIHRTRGTAPTSGIYTVASGQNLCLGCHNK